MCQRYQSLYSIDELNKIHQSTVSVCGLGGYGSAIIDAFSRYEFAHLRLADPDKFEISNMDRQMLAKFSSIGKSKASIACELVTDITKNTTVAPFFEGICPENVNTFCTDSSTVVDLCDQLGARLILRMACSEKKVPLIVGGSRFWPNRSGLRIETIRYDRDITWDAKLFPFKKWGLSKDTWENFSSFSSPQAIPKNLLHKINLENAAFRKKNPPVIYGSKISLPWNSSGGYDPLKVMALATGIIEATLTILLDRNPQHHRVKFINHSRNGYASKL